MTIVLLRLLAKSLVVLLASLHPIIGPNHTVSFRVPAPTAPVTFTPHSANTHPVGGPPPAAPYAQRHGPTRELSGLRTRTSRTFASGNGDYVTQISSESIDYRDASGAFQPIDDALVVSHARGYAYQNRSNRYTLYLPGDIAAAPVKIALGDYWVSSSLAGASGRGKVHGATDVFVAAVSGVTVTYAARPDGVDELLALPGPSAPATYTYTIRTGGGLTAGLNADGTVSFLARDGQVVFTIPAPSMSDSRGASGAARFELATLGSDYLLTLRADRSWMDDAARAWPVVIDPPFNMGIAPNTSATCTITSGSGTTCASGAGGSGLLVGFNGTTPVRSLLQFDVSPVPSNAQVVDANLTAFLNSSTNSTVTSVGLYPLTHTWTTSATWSTYDGSHAWATPGGDFTSGAGVVNKVDPNGSLAPWLLTSLAQSWVNGSLANDGIILKEPVENVSNVLDFSNYYSIGVSGLAPQLNITYTPRLGDQTFYKMDTQQLGDRLTAEVNVANGNLVLQQNDLHIKGTGMDLQVVRSYNNLANSVVNDLGAGWIFQTGADVGLATLNDGVVVYDGPGGFQAPFLPAGGGAFTAPAGLDDSLVQNGDGTYTLTVHSTGQKSNFSSQGFLVSNVDANGNTISYAYSNGLLASITDTQGRVTTVTTNSTDVTALKDSSGRSYSYGYSGPRITSYTDPAGKTTQYAYDGSGNLAQVTDPMGNRTTVTYDSQQRVTAITRVTDATHGTGPTTKYSYATGGGGCGTGTFASNTVVTDANGHNTTYCFDNQGRQTATVDAAGSRVTMSYTADNHLASSMDALGGATTSTYDGNNNLTGMTSASSLQDAAAYGDAGHPYSKTAQTTPEGATTAIAYDSNGNVASTTDPNNQTQTYTYNADGTAATYTDARGNRTAFSHDTHGNLTQVTYPSPRGSTTYTYDALSRVATTTDGVGRTTTFTYDALDRMTKLAYGGGSSVTYTYDADGNRTAVTDGTGTTTLMYDALNRVTKVTYPGGSSVAYGYDAAGNLASRTDSGGTEQRTYDSINEPVSVTDQGGATTTLGYDADHRNTTVHYPNGVTETFRYDASGLTLSVTATNSSGANLTSFTYGYVNPATGKATSKIYSVVDVTGSTTKYTYDGSGRLTAAVQTTGSGQTTASYRYAFDPNGNLTSQTVGSTTTSFTNDSDNQMVNAGGVAYSYDGAGSLTGSGQGLSLTYTSSAQTASVTPSGGSSVAMTYRDVGQVQRVGAGSTVFQYDTTGLSQMTASGQTTDFTHFANGAALSARVGGSTYYYLHDAMGSIVGLLDSAGTLANSYAYDPFGSATRQTEAVANPFRWIGAVRDASTGLYKIGARYYSPGLGRFTQPDPLSVESPSYSYAGGDPINGSDASGLFCCLSWWWNWHWWGYSGGVQFHLSHYDVQVIAFWWPPLAGLIGTIIGAIIGNAPGAIIGAVVGFVIGVVALWPIYNNDLICGCGSWVAIGVWGNWWSFWWPHFSYWTWR